MADLSVAELATLHAIVEEQQAKWVVPQPVPVPEPWDDYEDEPWDVTVEVPVPVKAPPTVPVKAPPTVPHGPAKAAPTWAQIDEWGRNHRQEARRVLEEARRSSASASASASVADAIVYVPATGAKFHNRPRCGSMKTVQPVTLACVEARGYTRCGGCW